MSELSNLIKGDIENFLSSDEKSNFEDRGTVIKVNDGVATVSGLYSGKIDELVFFSSGAQGTIFNLEDEVVRVIIMSDYNLVKEGDEVKCSKKSLTVHCGEGLLGRVVDALGNPIDGEGDIKGQLYEKEIEAIAPDIMARSPVSIPMETGVKIIDALIPIGRGQRELIMGDRQTGKTALALSAIVNQAKINAQAKSEQDKVYCVYVAVGKRLSTIAHLKQYLIEKGAMQYTTIVVASASDTAPLQFIAPYAGCTIAEYFRDNSKNALIVYDDLSKHAIAYRQMSLLLRRSPGREAYPGDIFFIHSRLLERAAQMSTANGGGSLTALPIVETQAGDMSAYVPTNIISITDGQIFLESDLMNKKILPAINVGLSVSRVGSTAQTKAISSVAGKMKLELAQYREMQAFAQFASDLDSTTQKMLHKGSCLVELLKQSNTVTYSMEEQVVILCLGAGNYFDDVPPHLVSTFHDNALEEFRNNHSDILDTIRTKKALDDELREKIAAVLSDVKSNL